MNLLENIQNTMKSNDIDYYIIPTSDYHLSEYVSDYFKLREFVSGFTGSAGTLVIEQDKAGLWTDSRYYLQAERELPNSITLHKMTDHPDSYFTAYIENNLQAGQKIGFDGKCMSTKEGKRLLDFCEKSDAYIVIDALIADGFWTNRPGIPKTMPYILSEDITGENIQSKIDYVSKAMKKNSCHYHIMSKLDDIAYFLNMRGNDVPYNPVFYSYLTIFLDSAFENPIVTLYLAPEKCSKEVEAYLKKYHINLKDYNEIYIDMQMLQNKTFLLDDSSINFTLYNSIPQNNSVLFQTNPITLKKSIKNDTELKHMIDYHKIDAVAMIKLIHYIKKNIGKETMSEISVADTLESFRKSHAKCLDLSFETIAGYKDHGAIVHYSATEESNYELQAESILLLDSGAQYLGATTDITRSIALGNPTKEEKHDFTTVLKGHLALSNAVFPKGATGTHLDTIAKFPLWLEHMLYFHGTGHGVGAFLNVHEGPQRISPIFNDIVFERGMVISNEPGFYKAGVHGIRIENLIYAEYDTSNEFGDFLKFVDLTLVPIDLDLVDISLLNETERNWLNQYHKRVYDEISPLIEDAELREFLKESTRAI